ncbi:type II toxin-antitoxin system RelE/ParE family toxin [Candidatus Wolfebacteria bacterium]|nr:type II toxin-antitoxin system RelE/ParE family toxin [Candidatus Wolfebacteria bacterium]
MPYEIFIERRAEKEFIRLPQETQNRIKLSILNLKNNPRPAQVRKISGSKNYYRLRVGDYRIVYEVDDSQKKINIFRIRHRKEAYLNL